MPVSLSVSENADDSLPECYLFIIYPLYLEIPKIITIFAPRNEGSLPSSANNLLKQSFMKKFFYLLSVAVMTALSLTSCLSNEDKENSYYVEDFYTVTGNLTTGYKLYSDNGTYITLDQTCFTNKDGFGTAERVLMTSVYTESMITQDQKGLVNPDIASCIIIPTTNPMSLDDAVANKVIDADSCAAVAKLNCWAYRGYLTAAPTAYYGNVRPTLSLVYDPATVRTDSIDLQLCYNIHDAKISSSGMYYTSFRLDPISYLVPGGNDVIVTIKCKGTSDIKLKVPRLDLRKATY